MDNQERLEHGTAVIRGTLGGARPHASLAALIGAWHGDVIEAYGYTAILAIADIDSELERAATDRARLAGVVANNTELRRSATESARRAESLQARNDNQAETIRAYDARHKEAMTAGESIVAELDECRESLKGMAINRDEWKAEARQQDIRASAAERQRNEAIDRANTAESRLERLMGELSGLTLGMLPRGAYGGALADVYCDIKRDMNPAAPSPLKAEMLGTLDSVAEGLIESDDAIALLRSMADRL